MHITSGWANNCGIQLATLGHVECPKPEDIFGGFWLRHELEYRRREKEKRRRELEKEQNRLIEDELDRALALEERKIEDEEARKAELTRLLRLSQEYSQEVSAMNERVSRALDEATTRMTFSTMERLEREIARHREEEEFLLIATILLDD